jgi:hypothetical protein
VRKSADCGGRKCLAHGIGMFQFVESLFIAKLTKTESQTSRTKGAMFSRAHWCRHNDEAVQDEPSHLAL